MKRVSSEKKPCSRPASGRTSPRRSPRTNVLPSRTLRVRSDTGECIPRARERHGSKGTFVRGGDDVDVAILAHPGPAVPRGDPLEPAYRVAHPTLIMDEEASLPIDDELARRALGERD